MSLTAFVDESAHRVLGAGARVSERLPNLLNGDGHRGRLEPPVRSPTSPRVTVVVPCYNYGRYLRTCVESAIFQEGVDVDVLIVDDASTDNTAEVATQLAASHPCINVMTHPHNAGMITTFNDGLRAATGKYVVLISADDLLTPGSLKRSADLLEAHSEVGFVYGFPLNFSGEPPQARLDVSSWTLWPGDRWTDLALSRTHSLIHSPEGMVRNEVQREVGYFSPNLLNSPDYEMWLRLAHVSTVGRINGPAQAYRRQHELNYTRVEFGGALNDLSWRMKAIEQFLDQTQDEGRAERRRHRSRQAIAEEALCHAQDLLQHTGDNDGAHELANFAFALMPDMARRVEWHALRCRLDGDAPTTAHMVGRASGIFRQLWRRAIWHRWKMTGL